MKTQFMWESIKNIDSDGFCFIDYRRKKTKAGISEDGTIRFHLIRKYTFDLVSAKCGIYEAKLLVGKKAPISDITYLYSLEDRLINNYKKFAHPLLELGGGIENKQRIKKINELIEKLEAENLKPQNQQRIEREALLNKIISLEKAKIKEVRI